MCTKFFWILLTYRNVYVSQRQLNVLLRTRWCSKEHGVYRMAFVTLRSYYYPNISGWPLPLRTQEVITQHVSAVIFKIMSPTYWCHELDLTRSHDVIAHMTIQLAIYFIQLVSHRSRTSILNRFQNIYIQIYLDHDLDLLGPRGVITHVTIWFHRCHSIRCTIVTESLSSAIFEIMSNKYIGVTT